MIENFVCGDFVPVVLDLIGCLIAEGIDYNNGIPAMNEGNLAVFDSAPECCNLCRLTPGQASRMRDKSFLKNAEPGDIILVNPLIFLMLCSDVKGISLNVIQHNGFSAFGSLPEMLGSHAVDSGAGRMKSFSAFDAGGSTMQAPLISCMGLLLLNSIASTLVHLSVHRSLLL